MYPNVEDYWDGIQSYHHLPPTSDKSVEYTINKEFLLRSYTRRGRNRMSAKLPGTPPELPLTLYLILMYKRYNRASCNSAQSCVYWNLTRTTSPTTAANYPKILMQLSPLLAATIWDLHRPREFNPGMIRPCPNMVPGNITEIVYDLDHSEDYARFSTGTIYSSKQRHDSDAHQGQCHDGHRGRTIGKGARGTQRPSQPPEESITNTPKTPSGNRPSKWPSLHLSRDRRITEQILSSKTVITIIVKTTTMKVTIDRKTTTGIGKAKTSGLNNTVVAEREDQDRCSSPLPPPGIATFTRDLRRVDWPADFNPAGIEKYGGKTDPESWLTIYTLAIRAAGGDSKAMANYLPVALTDSTRSWPLGLRDRFVANFQGTYERPGIQFDVYHVIQLKNKLLKDFIRRFFETCNKIPEDTNNVIIVNFQKGIRDENLIGKFTRKPPLTVMKLFKTANSAEAINIVREDKQSSAPHLVKDNNEYHKKDRNRRPGNLVATTSYCQSHCPSARNYNRILNGPSPNHPNSKHPAKD
uniref:Retrotransposon protein, putative, Ty3-gypsy subclass n=1 Tax=Oryza sativa subsp. japonica TaxID=39947 RepID=Q60E35_ORYSJ|nr:hypothetical protein [Oryza sativa Japonica Group]